MIGSKHLIELKGKTYNNVLYTNGVTDHFLKKKCPYATALTG